MEETEDWKGLRTVEKLAHKNWRARVEACEEFSKKLDSLSDPNSFSEIAPLLKRVPLDTNLPAQEKELSLVLKILETNETVFKQISHDFFAGLVSKCLNSKPKTRVICTEIFLQSVENGDQNSVYDALKSGLSAKQPKIISSCVDIFTRLLHDFGSSTINFKPFLLESMKLLDHSDKSVRDSIKSLIVEVYKWNKEGVRLFINNVKPVQQKELDEEFKKFTEEICKPCRFVGGLKNQINGSSIHEDASEDSPSFQKEIDSYENIDSFDIISLIPSKFYSEIVEVKWQTRKEALDNLDKILDVPKITNGDFSNLINFLKGIIAKDSNINVISSTIKCLSKLGNGLRKSFSQNAISLAPLVIGMFKEKRGLIVEICRNCLDNFTKCIDFEQFFTICASFIKHKSPSVREETLKFIGRLIVKNSAGFSKQIIKNTVFEIAKALEDSLPNVRDVSSESLAILMKIVGEKAVMNHLENLDDFKKSKVIEKFNKLTDRDDKKQLINEFVKIEKPHKEQTSIDKVDKKCEAICTKSDEIKSQPIKNEDIFESDLKDPPEISISLDSVLTKAVEIFGQEFIDLISSNNWKDRLSANEEIENRLDELSIEKFDIFNTYLFLSYKPGWKDTNFQVISVKYKLISYLCRKHSPFPLRIVHELTHILAERISDSKLKDLVYETLFNLSEISSLNFVNLRLIKHFNTTKNVKNQAEILRYISKSLIEFGFKIDIKIFMQFFKTCSDLTNPDLKKALLETLKTIYLIIGPKFRFMINDWKSAFLVSVESEFEKSKNQSLPQPTRVKLDCKKSEIEIECKEKENQTLTGMDIEKFITRKDITDQLTAELFAEISDKNWKIRNAGLEKICQILKNEKHIEENIGQLPSVLASRLSDTNKNLIILSLNIFKDLISSVGVKIQKLLHSIIPPILTTLSDGKPQIRTAAILCLDEWVSVCGPNSFLESQESIIFPIINGRNSSSKYEIITWLAKIVSHKNIPEKYLISLVDPVLTLLTDRNAELRKSVQNLVGEIALTIGVEAIQKKACNLEQTSLNILKGIFDSEFIKKNTKENNKEELNVHKRKTTSIDESNKKIKLLSHKDNKEYQDKSSDDVQKKVLAEKELRIIYKPNTKMIRSKTFSVLSMGPKEFLKMINGQILLYFTPYITNDLLSPDYKKVAKGIQNLINILNEPINNDEILAVIECSDLIIGYISCRIFDASPNILTKLFDLLQKYLEFLISQNKKLNSEEIECILTPLIQKLNENKETYRKISRYCIKNCVKLSNSSTVINYILNGINSKLNRIRHESLSILNHIIQSENVLIAELPNCSKICLEIAKLLSEKDNSFRSLSTSFFALFYEQIGTKVFDHIGPIGIKESVLLNEKFKQINTNFLKGLNESDHTNKTFIISKSQNSSIVDDKSISAENSCLEPLNSKEDFDIIEYLEKLNINLSIDDVKVTEFSFESLPEISFPIVEINDEYNLINIPIFLKLAREIKNISIENIDLKSYLNSFPILFDVSEIANRTVDSILFSVQKLLTFIYNDGDDLFVKECECFEIISFFLHLRSFVRKIDSEVLFQIISLIFDIISIKNNIDEPNCKAIIAICKAILCFMTECYPVTHLFSVFIKVLFNIKEKNSHSWRILKYLYEIIVKRMQRRSPITHIDSMKLFSDIKLFKEFSFQNQIMEKYKEIEYIIDKILNESIHLLQIQNSEHIDIIKNKFPFVEQALKNTLINPCSSDIKTISESMDDLFVKLVSSSSQRLIISKTIMQLSIEYEYSLTSSHNFNTLYSSLKIFYRLYFDDACRSLVKTVLKSFVMEPEKNINDKNEFEFYLNRAKQFGAVMELASTKIYDKVIETPEKIPNIPSDPNIEDAKFNNNNKSINNPLISDHSSPLKLPQKNIENLKKRLENIKKGFKT